MIAIYSLKSVGIRWKTHVIKSLLLEKHCLAIFPVEEVKCRGVGWSIRRPVFSKRNPSNFTDKGNSESTIGGKV